MDDDRFDDQVKRGIATAVDTAKDLAGKAQAAVASGTVRNAATETAKQVTDAATKTYAQGAQAAQYLSRNTAEQPLLALVIAGAIGYAIAYMIHAR
jgi:hypothetical protein